MNEKVVRWAKYSLDPAGAFMRGLCKGFGDGFKLIIRITIGIAVLFLSHPLLGLITQSDKEKNIISLALFLIVVLGGIWKLTPSIMLGVFSMSVIWVETEGVIITALLGILTRWAHYSEEEREASLHKTIEAKIDEHFKGIRGSFSRKDRVENTMAGRAARSLKPKQKRIN